VVDEVATGCLRRLHTLCKGLFVNVEVAVGHDGFDIFGCLDDVTVNVHCEARRFRNRKTEVERENGRNAAQTDDKTPDWKYKISAITLALNFTARTLVYGTEVRGVRDDLVLECRDADDSNNSRRYNYVISNLLSKSVVEVVPKLPQPWNAKTAVMMRPRIRVAANSDEITEDNG
jgi:hypothetical protein